MRSVAIVGASLAGLRSAEALRQQGFDGRITVIGAERQLPYDRPPLSKDFLLGTVEQAGLALAEDEDYATLAADWRLGVRAERLDAAGGRLLLSDGSELRADGVVIATGGRPRTLPGTKGVAGVHTLRTLDDAIALRTALAEGPANVIVVGAGFLGAEVAASARALGLSVTVLEAMDIPLRGAIGPELGAVAGQLHADHGVRLICGHGVAGLLTSTEPGERRVRMVCLDNGRELPADLVVVAIGMRPNSEWLAGSPIPVDNGVLTDGGWLTEIPTVAAVGDVARHATASAQRRHEHWTNASDQPSVAIANLLGGRHLGHCDCRGYFWSDQYGVRIQFAGSIAGTDDVRIVAGSPADRSFLASYHRDGTTTGVLAMNMAKAFNRARRTLLSTLEEDDICRNCSSGAAGGTRPTAAEPTSSIPSINA
ncbi:MAG TPA: FAD-dependent oxidoreductase [Pseudonocardiaceae bacterium]|jgi:3-phenylpropionate/trans-cinnamate dioxygenase ferredoxin reductase subunit|nr:FAD-dependent oxidoreductase [Pseudonocardiaceae bacterium]